MRGSSWVNQLILRRALGATLLLPSFVLAQLAAHSSLLVAAGVSLIGLVLSLWLRRWLIAPQLWLQGAVLGIALAPFTPERPLPLREQSFLAVVQGAPRYSIPGGVELSLRLTALSSVAAPSSYRVLCSAPALPWRNLATVEADARLVVRTVIEPIPRSLNPFSYSESLRRRGYEGRCRIRAATVPKLSRPGPARGIVVGIGEQLTRALGSGEARGLVSSMVFGERAVLSLETERLFKDAGFAHLLVVSGYQVGLVAAAILFLLRFVPRRIGGVALSAIQRALPRVCACVAALLFALLVGGEAACLRAVVALVFLSGAAMLGRERRGTVPLFHPLSVVLLIVSALFPGAILDPGVQLTFAALLGLSLGSTEQRRAGWRSLLIASLGASLLTGIVGAIWFRKLSVIGILINPVLAPLVSVVGCLGGVVGLLLMAAGASALGELVLGGTAAVLAGVVILLDLLVASFPGAVVTLDSGTSLVLVVVLLGLAAALLARGRWIEFCNREGLCRR